MAPEIRKGALAVSSHGSHENPSEPKAPKGRKQRSLEGREHLYSEKTHLIHGRYQSVRWDYTHHVVPPLACSAP